MKNKVLSFQNTAGNSEFKQEASAIFSDILSQFNLTKRTPRERVPWRLIYCKLQYFQCIGTKRKLPVQITIQLCLYHTAAC